MGSEGLSQSILLYRLTDRLPVRTALLVAVQHVLAMFVGVVTVPLLVAQSLKLPPNETSHLVSMGLIASGFGTLVQVRGLGGFGSRLLAVQGTSFTFLVPLIQAGQAGGLPLPEAVRLVFSSGITTGGISALVLNAVLPGQRSEVLKVPGAQA